MTVRIYRNLDRPFELFGIRGKFIGIAGALAVVCIIISIVVGVATNTFIGIATLAVMLILSYFAISQVQVLLGTLTIERRLSAMGMPKFVIINSKVWKR